MRGGQERPGVDSQQRGISGNHRTGQLLDAIKEVGIEDDTLVIFTSDNGPEATYPWKGDSGPWRGTYFTAMEVSLRAPFMGRYPKSFCVAAVYLKS